MMAGMRHYKRLLAICGTAAVLLSNMASASLLAYANEQTAEYVEAETSAAAAEADSGQTGPYQSEGQSEPDAYEESVLPLEEEPEIAVCSEEDSDDEGVEIEAVDDDLPVIESVDADEDADSVEQPVSEESEEWGAGSLADAASDDAEENAGEDTSSETPESDSSLDGTDTEVSDVEESGNATEASDAGNASDADEIVDKEETAGDADADAADSDEDAADSDEDAADSDEDAADAENPDDAETNDAESADTETPENEVTDEDAEPTEEEETEESDEDDDDPVTYDAEIDGITVYVEVPYDAFSEDVDLVVSMIRSERDLEEVSDTLDASDVSYDGYLALDIHFENEDGDEIEPDGEVRVTFDLAENVLPAEADTETLSVQHFDTSSGDVEVVTVADTTSDKSTGDVTVSGNTESQAGGSDVTAVAEFEVSSFSTFTITWNYNNGWWGSSSQDLSVICVDENGSELPATAAPGTISLSSGREVSLTSDNSDLAMDGYELVGVSAYVNNTTYENVTSIKASYSSRGWSSGWTYTLYSGTSQVYSGSTKPSLTLIYGVGELMISYTLDADDAYGSAPQSQTAELNGYITLPECIATRDGYTFLGWTEQEFKITGDNSDLQAIYQPGERYKVTGSQTLHAAWSRNEDARADFYIKLNATIPAIDYSENAAYTSGIYISSSVKDKKWIYDTDGSQLVEESGRDYLRNEVSDNQTGLPTNAQIMSVINASYNSGAIHYHVNLDANNRLYVDYVRSASADTPFAAGQELYMLWYAQKYQATLVDNNWTKTWHIDGVLLAKDKVTIKYVENAKGTVTGMPTGYQVTKGTTVRAGSSASATGTVMEPHRQNYEFLGWNTKADNSGTFYASGSDITLDENTTLYAIWKDPTAGIVDTGIQLGTASHAAMICVAMGAVVMVSLYTAVRRRCRVR